jgi:hypothetical protein
MKIRLNGNSIRYRLSKTDIANFGEHGFIEEKTEFPGKQYFYYCLQKKEVIKNIEASFSGNRICIFVPENIATEWTTTDMVGFDSKMSLGEKKELLLLIEKDFVCMDETLEDQQDNYPNPKSVY